MSAGQVITGVAISAAKGVRKYTLKGAVKVGELATRGAIKGVDSIVQNNFVQKIVTGAGIFTIGTLIPPVATAAVTILTLKYLYDKFLEPNVFKRDRNTMFSTIDGLLESCNGPVHDLSNMLSSSLNRGEKAVQNKAKTLQTYIDLNF